MRILATALEIRSRSVDQSLLVAPFHGLAFRRVRRALCRHWAAIRSYPEALGITVSDAFPAPRIVALRALGRDASIMQ
jgi:hypothetical protein